MEATGFGVMAVDTKEPHHGFRGKAKDPPGIPGAPDKALASMGILSSRPLRWPIICAAMPPTRIPARDFGKDIIPHIVKHGKAVAHRFTNSCVRSAQEPRPTGATWEPSMPIGRRTLTSPNTPGAGPL